ncbi:AraC family transcriptional regulator [Herbiconiux sp. UC225_62]|uniref:helix-turn-helix transcriptional regulator n=1 Tax=Herbiconiux sp. UC225_62 TaxID=3350168 RepID=UPI0036D33F1E
MTLVATAADPHPLSEFLARLRLTATALQAEELAAGDRRMFEAESVVVHHLRSGSAAVARLGECAIVRAGDVVVLPHGGSHTVTALEDGQLVTARLRVDGATAATLLSAQGFPQLMMACGLALNDPVVTAVAVALRTEVQSRRPGSATLAQGLAAVLAAAVMRSWVENGCLSAGTDLALTLRDPHIARAVEAIHAEPGAPWTVAGLARLAQSSRSVFSEQFRRAVGEPPLGYLAQVRMDRAKALLSDEGLSVGQTAAAVGYRSDEAFSRAFRRHTGTSPTAWRRGE